MAIISYAQNFEDVMLWRALADVEKGFYIDVGANDPEVDSVTRAFYDAGWSGINIEPMEEYFDRLAEARPRDICLKLAAGSHEGEMTFFEIEGTGLSTAFELIAEKHLDRLGFEHRQVVVQVQTLTSICETYCEGPIHFLKIDVEGGEADVISGLDLSRFRPWIMVIEAVEPLERLLRNAPWRQDVEDQGYEFCYFDGVNEYFLAKEQSARRRFFEAPPNCFDEFRLSSTHRMLPPLVEELSQGLERQRAEREALSKRAAELEKSLSDKVLELAESLKQLREAEQREAESLQRLEESEEREAGAQARLRELEEALQQADGDLTAARQRSASLEGELQALLNSRSWKATRPLRALLSLTKKGG